MVSSLPLERRIRIPFKNNRPGNDFMKSFLRLHPVIRMRRRAALEQRRKMAMSPRNMAMHFALLQHVYRKYRIASPAQVFNIDELGVSSRSSERGKG